MHRLCSEVRCYLVFCFCSFSLYVFCQIDNFYYFIYPLTFCPRKTYEQNKNNNNKCHMKLEINCLQVLSAFWLQMMIRPMGYPSRIRTQKVHKSESYCLLPPWTVTPGLKKILRIVVWVRKPKEGKSFTMLWIICQMTHSLRNHADLRFSIVQLVHLIWTLWHH